MLFYFFLYTFLLVSVFHGSSKLTEVSAISDEQTSAAGAVKLPYRIGIHTKVSIYQKRTIYDFTVIAYKSSTNLTLPDKIITLTTNKIIDSSPTSFFSSSNIFFLFLATQRRGNKERITGFHDPPIK